MLFDLVDILQRKRRLLYVVLFVGIDFLLLSLCSQTLQVHRANIATRIHNSQIASQQVQYQSDLLTGGSLADALSQTADTLQVGTLRVVVASIDGLTTAKNGIQTVVSVLFRAIATVFITLFKAIIWVVRFIIRALYFIVLTLVRTVGVILRFTGRVIAFPFVAAGHGFSHVANAASGLTHSSLASVIQPQSDQDEIPVITREQAQQATLIQENTLAVTPVKPTGSGGACDSGAGNGGYPMEWCDARMDTIRTVSYSNDHINRECTSYAYWYFTTVEGHGDFHVTGNANRWASTSNYPTHTAPAVGSIAVETGGYYGHVAIVQALPGETYEGNTVPNGYILVSEMNYDWKGHFRYSYSPLSKFSAYIY